MLINHIQITELSPINFELLIVIFDSLLREVSKSGKKIENNDWVDVFLLTYVQENDLYWTNEKSKIRLIKDSKLENFSGRVLKVEIIDSKQIRKGDKFNIISKNHPLTPDEIKKKYKISDGGNQYLIFTQTEKGKVIMKSV